MEVNANALYTLRQVVGCQEITEAEARRNREKWQEFAPEFKHLEQLRDEQPSNFGPAQRKRYAELSRLNWRPRRARAAVAPLVPVSESGWHAGVKCGKFPKGIKLGGSTFYRGKDLLALVNGSSANAAPPAAANDNSAHHPDPSHPSDQAAGAP